MGGDAVVEMAVRNNAALAKVYFPEAPIGEIGQGARADLMVVDYEPPPPLSGGNLPWHILFGFRDSMVCGTLVDGEVLMWDRRLTHLDEAEIAAKARERVPQVWNRYQAFVPHDGTETPWTLE